MDTIKKAFSLIVLCLLSLSGCEVFLPSGGGEGQPCIETREGDCLCRKGLNPCDDGICRASCDVEESPGTDESVESDGDGQWLEDGGSQDDDELVGTEQGDTVTADDGGMILPDEWDVPDEGPPPYDEYPSTDSDQTEEIPYCLVDDDCSGAGYVGVCFYGTCYYFENTPEEMCTDGYDNDGDGDKDLADTECGGGEECFDDRDKDGYAAYVGCGGLDCNDDVAGVGPGAIEYGTLCSDGVDNDCDGLTDTGDDSCQSSFNYNADFRDVWVFNGGHAWIGGVKSVLEWNGNKWWSSPNVDFDVTRVWAHVSEYVQVNYAVDDAGRLLLSENGADYRSVQDLAEVYVNDVWGVHQDKVYAVGCKNAVSNPIPTWFEWDGASWKQVNLAAVSDTMAGYCLVRVFGRGFHSTYALATKAGAVPKLVVLTDGADAPRGVEAWNVKNNGQDYVFNATALWVDGRGDVWIGGNIDDTSNGKLNVIVLVSFDGNGFRNHSDGIGDMDSGNEVKDIFGIGGTKVVFWMAAGKKIIRKECDDAACQSTLVDWEYIRPQGVIIHAIGGSHANDLWAVGERGLVLHRDASGCVASVDASCVNWRTYHEAVRR